VHGDLRFREKGIRQKNVRQKDGDGAKQKLGKQKAEINK
jgi:hypothetical protein